MINLFQAGCYSKCVSRLNMHTQSNLQCLFLPPISCTYSLQILLQCRFVLVPVLTLYNTFVSQCLIMACPCAVPLSAPLCSLIFTDCLCCFLGRRDDIVQTSSLPASPPPMITLFLFSGSRSPSSSLLPTLCLCVSCSCGTITVFECNSPDRTLV